MTPEPTDAVYKVPQEEVGKPLGQEDMRELLKARRENLVVYDWFLSYGRAREVFERLRSDNGLVAAEILETIEQPDASEIKLEFRWPVKSDVVSGEDVYGGMVRKVKSYPSTYNYVTINFDRVQTRWSGDYGSEPAWMASVEGEKVESALLAAGSLRPVDVEDAIQKAFSNPKIKDLETSEEESTNSPLPK